MRKSSAAQQIFDFDDATAEGVGAPEILPERAQEDYRSNTTDLHFPDFGKHVEVYAATARLAGRMNAASVSKEEKEALLKERRTLLDKKFAGTITRKEEIRLEYVRWSLDRIEDAIYGQDLDALDAYVSRYERFLGDLRALQSQLNQHAGRGKL